MALSCFVLQYIPSNCVILDDNIPEFSSCNRLDSYLEFLGVFQVKKSAESTIDLVVLEVIHMARHLVVELNIRLNTLCHLVNLTLTFRHFSLRLELLLLKLLEIFI
jgi:hypothetical protein